MNATSSLVLIMVMAFAADRMTKAMLFLLGFVPAWRRRFVDPEILPTRAERARMKNRHLIAYTVIVGTIAGTAVLVFPELRIIAMLSGPSTAALIDVLVTALVVMGGSDLVGRILQVSGIGNVSATSTAGAAGADRRDGPIEVVGRLVIENEQQGPIHLTVAEKPVTSAA